ncbi:MAG TPA: twin transmembrane helix small protein [Nitrosospira sp.]|nr:twin transmembrane helix small protein [Nitrosospira sp.]
MVIVLLLFLIFASLGSALYYLVKDKGHDTRVVRSLTLRIGLSLFLFTLLMVGTYFGFIPL